MRIDRVYNEGEAVNALKEMKFVVEEQPRRPGQFLVSHTEIGGERTMSVEQMCCFAEGASAMMSYLKDLQTNVKH